MEKSETDKSAVQKADLLEYRVPLNKVFEMAERLQGEGAWGSMVWVDPKRMGGAPCVRGTRVPVHAVLQALADAEAGSFGKVFEAYPQLSAAQVRGALEFAALVSECPEEGF